MPLIELNADLLNSASRDSAARLALEALTRIQNEKPHEQVFAASLLFAAFCKRLGLSAHEMHTKALRMLEPDPFHDKGNAQIETLADFAGFRLSDKPIKPTSMS